MRPRLRYLRPFRERSLAALERRAFDSSGPLGRHERKGEDTPKRALGFGSHVCAAVQRKPQPAKGARPSRSSPPTAGIRALRPRVAGVRFGSGGHGGPGLDFSWDLTRDYHAGAMRVEDFQYELPPELIAQSPAERRDESRLLVLHRATGRREHRGFRDLPEYLRAGDVLVLNDSRVIPARLYGRNHRTGGNFEILLLEQEETNLWWALLRPGKRARRGTRINITAPRGHFTGLWAEVLDKRDAGEHRLQFHGTNDVLRELDRLGRTPLPPYIQRPDGCEEPVDRERYQTVYARVPGSVAAPTAGLHFTPELLDTLRSRGVEITFVTLHVGLGTFAPVRVAQVEQHVMHEERFELPESTARILQAARTEGRRIIAVGTTTVRVLETVAGWYEGQLCPTRGRTRLFIYPPYRFRAVDALITNFHLPGSTLLMLVSAFAAPGDTRGRQLILETYAEAVRQRYRFFSYGDAMLIL